MSKDFKLNIKREDIGCCKGCGADPKSEVFKGHVSESPCTHMSTESGWWLRIDHRYDYTMEGRERLPDVVGELRCPTCREEYDKNMLEFLELVD